MSLSHFGLSIVQRREIHSLPYRWSNLGSTTVAATASGPQVSKQLYSAFGASRYTSGSLPTSFKYTGQRADSRSSLYYYNARYSNPATGRFIQPDSIVPQPYNPSAWDRYAYVNNNPINSTDSSGHCIDGLTTVPCLVALIVVAGFAGGAANYEYNVSGNSWWESSEEALATAQAGFEGALLAVGTALTAGQVALMTPEVAMYFGSKTGNTSVYSWGATRNGLLPLSAPNPTVNLYSKMEFQGRTVYQRNDIDWNFVDPETGLTNMERAQKGWAPIGPDGEKINLHHLLQQEPGPMAEIPATVHQSGQTTLHGLIGPGQSFRNNPFLNRQYNQFRTDYWKWRAGGR